jgi:nucleoside phosphorylase
MNLLVFAHRGEAQEFLNYFKLKPCEFYFDGLYTADELMLLITGEGPDNVYTRLGAVIAAYPSIDNIINLGIAGALNSKLELNTIHKVGTVYAFKDDAPAFHSSTASLDGVDLVTVEKRVVDNSFAQKLRPIADMVDREAHAIGQVCRRLKKQFLAYKLISDYAGEQTQCFDIKKRALFYSNTLLEFYLKLDFHQSEIDSDHDFIKSESLHMSFTQKNEVAKLLDSLSLIEKKTSLAIWNELDIQQYVQIDNPKLRTKKLIQDLYYRVNPLMMEIDQRLLKVTHDLRRIGADVHFDPKFERKGFQLKMTINNQGNVNRLKQALDTFQFEQVNRVFEGDLNV